ncbi:RHS repeat-associated core domain-containing protein [Pseudomonas sp. LB3P81]
MPRTLLLATDNSNSILVELTGGEPNPIAYSAYGQQSAPQAIASHLGFNGELSEKYIGWYLLGKGYRAYNPNLMRFHSPDSWSPFGEGGLNAYMYCGGDPVNFSDPTGRLKLFSMIRRTRHNPPPDLAPIDTAAANARRTVQENVYQRFPTATDPAAVPIVTIPRDSPPPRPPRNQLPPLQPRNEHTGGRSTGRSRTPRRIDSNTAMAGSNPNPPSLSAGLLPDGSTLGLDGVIRHPNGLEVGVDGVERMTLSDLRIATQGLPQQRSNPSTSNRNLRRS